MNNSTTFQGDGEVAYIPVVVNGKQTRQTHGDSVRSMSDEELAELLSAVAQKSANKLCESLKTVEVDLSNCNFQILYETHLDWLKKECE